MRAGAPGRRQQPQLRGSLLRLAAVAALVAAASVISFQLGSGHLRPASLVPEPVCAQPLFNATAAIAGGRPEKPQQVGAKGGNQTS